MNKYELLLIFDPGLADSIVNEKAEKIKKWIERFEGSVTEIKDNGIEKLAYEIKKSRQGHRVEINFELDPDKINTLREEIKLDESIWRIFIKRI